VPDRPGEALLRNPITGTAGCCARAPSDQDASPLLRRVMNSRRFMTPPSMLLGARTEPRVGRVRQPPSTRAHLAAVLSFSSGSFGSTIFAVSVVCSRSPRLPGSPKRSCRVRPVSAVHMTAVAAHWHSALGLAWVANEIGTARVAVNPSLLVLARPAADRRCKARTPGITKRNLGA